jgi:hypothetical protein
MTTWMLRGLVFAAGMVIVRLVQGTLIDSFETKAGTISFALVVLFWICSFTWGFIDGRSDAKDNWDPDRRRDLAMTWLLAGLIAGVVSGAVTWIISLVYPMVYVEGLISELTTFAAFTALAVFIPAVIAVAIGRFLIDRKRGEMPRRREDGTGTDVFDSVREEETTGPIPRLSDGAAAEERTSPVVLAKRTEDDSPGSHEKG